MCGQAQPTHMFWEWKYLIQIKGFFLLSCPEVDKKYFTKERNKTDRQMVLP